MANPFSKGWKYLMQSLDTKIEENADPKVQIQQAAEAAKKQHAEISQRAASIIGNRNQLEMKLNRLLGDQKKLVDNTRMAMQQADAAAQAGDQAKATDLNQTAEVFASQLVTVEQEIEETKQLHAGAVEAAKQAEQQQKQSSARLEEQMNQINQLRAQVDQAKMQETTAKSMNQLNGLANDDSVPTLDGVREKIEARYAKALGAQELVENSVHSRMDEIASAGNDMRAQSRLDQIRAEMGQLGGGTSAGTNPALNAGTGAGNTGAHSANSATDTAGANSAPNSGAAAPHEAKDD